MKNEFVLFSLLKVLIYGQVTYDYKDVLGVYNISEVKKMLEDIVLLNYQEQFLSKEEKNNILYLIGIFRFNTEYKTIAEKSEMYQWCNNMIGKINQSQEDNVIFNRLEVFVQHGYQFIQETIMLDEYQLLCKELSEMAKLEYFLLNNLKEKKDLKIKKEYLINEQLEHCIYYLTSLFAEKFDVNDYTFFIQLLEIKKILSTFGIKEKQKQYSIQFNGVNCCELRRDEMMELQEVTDVDFINELEEFLQQKITENLIGEKQKKLEV